MNLQAWLDERSDTGWLTADERTQIARIVGRTDVLEGSAILDFGIAEQIRFSGVADDVAARLDASRGPREELGRLLARVVDLEAGRQRTLGIELPRLAGWSDTEDGWLGRYESVRSRLDRLVADLHSGGHWLAREIALLDRLAWRTRRHARALDVLIVAGEAKLDELHGVSLPRMAREADDAVDDEVRERLSRFAERVEMFERRMDHLKSARTIGRRSVPQIRALQNDLETLLEQVQNALSTTIPLWKGSVIDAVTTRRGAESANLGQSLAGVLDGDATSEPNRAARMPGLRRALSLALGRG